MTAGSGTRVHGMTEAGQIVGAYPDGTGDHGFLRDPSGAFVTIVPPGPAPGTDVLVTAINDAGQVYGLNIADMACFIARPGPVD